MINVEVHQVDVTGLEVDAITNAANTQLKHGGGVAAAIARAGGPDVQRESIQKAPIGLGEAVETTAGDMPARLMVGAVREHDPRTLERVVFAVHGDAVEQAFRAAVES